jgi:hypothetical protein
MGIGRRDGMGNTEISAKDSDLEKIRENLDDDPEYRDIMGIYREREREAGEIQEDAERFV